MSLLLWAPYSWVAEQTDAFKQAHLTCYAADVWCVLQPDSSENDNRLPAAGPCSWVAEQIEASKLGNLPCAAADICFVLQLNNPENVVADATAVLAALQRGAVKDKKQEWELQQKALYRYATVFYPLCHSHMYAAATESLSKKLPEARVLRSGAEAAAQGPVQARV